MSRVYLFLVWRIHRRVVITSTAIVNSWAATIFLVVSSVGSSILIVGSTEYNRCRWRCLSSESVNIFNLNKILWKFLQMMSCKILLLRSEKRVVLLLLEGACAACNGDVGFVNDFWLRNLKCRRWWGKISFSCDSSELRFVTTESKVMPTVLLFWRKC